MSEGLGIIARFLFIIAVVVIAHGGWQIRTGNADMGKMSIVGGLLLGLAVVIVTHDLAVARLLSQRMIVMKEGRAVEEGLTDRVLDDPRHPYTQLLVASIPES